MMGGTPQRQLTVLMEEFKGPDATASAQRLSREISSQGLPDVFVADAGGGVADVCAGHFPAFKDPKAIEMLHRVHQIRDTAGQYPFAGVTLVPVPEAPPPSPWPLEKANGYFSLHIASWEAPGRMAKAQAYAAELRSQGYEAYVFHGPSLSMVTLGAWGLEIFDHPAAVGQPGAKPKIISPKTLDLIQKFPRMRLEGEVTPPEAHIPTQLVKVPGREPPSGAGMPLPKVLYRVSLALVETATGLEEERGRADGVAWFKDEIPTLTKALVKQIVGAIRSERPLRVGIVGVTPTDPGAIREKIDALALDALMAELGRTGTKAIGIGPEGTRQILAATGLKLEDVLRDPRACRGVQGLDAVLVGTVTSFPR